MDAIVDEERRSLETIPLASTRIDMDGYIAVVGVAVALQTTQDIARTAVCTGMSDTYGHLYPDRVGRKTFRHIGYLIGKKWWGYPTRSSSGAQPDAASS